jgi:hypothetical protein
MPLTIPNLDDRRYQDLLDEALARIPVYNPEWTNFNKSDPGVTLVELFAFLTENLLYRANQIPERNRKKFLSLLGVPLHPGSSARGLVTISNERGPLATVTLNRGLEVLAGKVPFRTENGLDVLPVEARVYIKKPRPNPSPELLAYYQQLYATELIGDASELTLYDTTPLPATGVDLGTETVDGAVWLALLARPNEPVEEARRQIGAKTLSLGVVPALDEPSRRLAPAGVSPRASSLLDFALPQVPAGGVLPPGQKPSYRSIPGAASSDVLSEPGVVEISLPPANELILWTNLDPLEAGLDEFPPALQDTKIEQRVITWLRLRSPAAVRARLLWVGINAAMVTQRARVSGELLPQGTGEPDQTVVLSRRPVIPESVTVQVTVRDKIDEWKRIEDLFHAGPEVPAPDLRLPPGQAAPPQGPTDVFVLNPESGEIRFGDGLRGRRPPAGAVLRATYDYGVGSAGNVNAGSVSAGPALPSGFQVNNPVRTWGGADPESAAEGEKQISRYLQHRDRLVTAEDFKTITWRTPGVRLGRVEVLPAFHPELAPNQPGDAAGAVTLLVIPKYDPVQPDAPVPDRTFLNAICGYLDPRRLVTNEVFLRGPSYLPVWVSVGITVTPGESAAEVRERVRKRLAEFLSPFRWPLRKAVARLELMAEASRVEGVQQVNGLSLAQGAAPPAEQVPMAALELPRLAGVAVGLGEPPGIDQIRGQAAAPTQPARRVVPVPVIPESC